MSDRLPETIEVKLVFRRLATPVKEREVYLLEPWPFDGDPPMAIVTPEPGEAPDVGEVREAITADVLAALRAAQDLGRCPTATPTDVHSSSPK